MTQTVAVEWGYFVDNHDSIYLYIIVIPHPFFARSFSKGAPVKP